MNILNNIKTERLTDDEKSKTLMDFSPRRQQKPREIINVKELQNDFVGNNIHIKKEVTEDIIVKEMSEKQKEIEVPGDDVTVEINGDNAEVVEMTGEEKRDVKVNFLRSILSMYKRNNVPPGYSGHGGQSAKQPIAREIL